MTAVHWWTIVKKLYSYVSTEVYAKSGLWSFVHIPHTFTSVSDVNDPRVEVTIAEKIRMGEKKTHQHLQKRKEYAGNSRDHSLHKHQCWHKSTAFSHYFTNALPYWSRGIGNTQLGCNCMLNNFLLFMYDVVEFIKNIADEIQIINQYKSPLYSARNNERKYIVFYHYWYGESEAKTC